MGVNEHFASYFCYFVDQKYFLQVNSIVLHHIIANPYLKPWSLIIENSQKLPVHLLWKKNIFQTLRTLNTTRKHSILSYFSLH